MKGTTVEVVASSWIEALGGASWKYILSVPPLFWAIAGVAAKPMAASAHSTAVRNRISFLLP